jgi:carboxylesterase
MRPFRLRSEFISEPVSNYEEAITRVREIQKQEENIEDLNPLCATNLLTHSEEVDNAVLFLHGFTSCPKQFSQLGRQFFEKGYNVYIPLIPRHGTTDLKGNTLKDLTAEELAEFANQSVDIVQGLGARVIVVGLSGGGSMATWLAQVRSDVDLAVLIAPALGIGFIPRILNRPLTKLILLAPNIYQWWDPINKENNPNATPYSYRRYPTHSLFENLRIGFAAEEEAKSKQPAAKSILVITNANDDSVNNGIISDFEELWLAHGELYLLSYQFPKEFGLPHDLISPERPDGNVEVVYPKLLELIH